MRTSSVCLILVLVCISSFGLLTPTARAISLDPGPQLGTNLAWLGPNTGEYPFVNLFPTSLGWIPGERWGCWNCGSLDLDDHGWVRSLDSQAGTHGQVAYIHQFQDLQGRYLAGLYTVVYDGVGTLEYEGSATLVSRDVAAGRDVIQVDPSHIEELIMVLVSTGPGNTYMKNIRLLPPGGSCSGDATRYCEVDSTCSTNNAGTCRLFANYNDTLLHPQFLTNLKPFSVVRMMDWMRTVDSELVSFDDYPTLDDAHWSRAPVAAMAELANVLDVDLWLNMPHNADGQFAATFANELNQALEPERKVLVEYSNEVWNPMFQQFHDVTEDGCALYGLDCDSDDATIGNSEPCEGHPFDHWSWSCAVSRIRLTADRAGTAWSAFETALGEHRVVRVLASQTDNSWMHAELLGWNGTASRTDVLATAAYFGWALGNNEDVAGWSETRLMEELRDVEVPQTIAWMRADADFLAADPARAHIQPVFYEGGQHLQTFGEVADDPALNGPTNLSFDNVNDMTAMGARYNELLSGWLTDGGGALFMHYVNVHPKRSWGRFGALEYQGQPHTSSPKYQALKTIFNPTP